MIMRKDYSDDNLPDIDLDELNQQAEQLARAYNTRPNPEMGGLSPDQVTGLLYSQWGAAGSPVQFNTDLPLAELERSSFFRESRTLLKAILDAGGVRATASKNLARPFVADVIELLCDQKTLAYIREHRSNVNERDIPPLHIARVVAQTSGLIRLYKGRFAVPRGKAPLLSDQRAGELFGCLFLGFFRRFNMAYARRLLFEMGGLQTCVGYTLYRLGIVAARWRSVERLEEQVLLPAVREQIEDQVGEHIYWTVNKILERCLLYPLIQWGLLEGREKQVSEYVTDLAAVRTTPLFKTFLRFHIER